MQPPNIIYSPLIPFILVYFCTTTDNGRRRRQFYNDKREGLISKGGFSGILPHSQSAGARGDAMR